MALDFSLFAGLSMSLLGCGGLVLVGILPVQRDNMSDGLDQFGTGLLTDLSAHFLALFTIFGVDAHFYELMMVQG